MLASSQTISASDPSQGDQVSLETAEKEGLVNQNQGKNHRPNEANSPLKEFHKLQSGSIFSTLVLSALVGIAAIFFEFHAAISLFVGGISGALYLWLLARSVEKLGKVSQNVSKTQLLVPVVLFLVAVRLPQLAVFPAMMGFLLYKPSMILQALLKF